uniref:Uncharacterized protein n=1 Tax=Cacopsylla melanoneura TaxID=428564 RepID=A0A8D8U2J3_9HEMI
MAKLSLLIVLLAVGVGFISCSQMLSHDSDLEQYLNEEDNHEEEEEEDGMTSDEEGDSNEVETQIEAPSLRSNPAMLAKDNAMNDFETLLNNEAMRTSLEHISDKLKQLFSETKTREATKNILKNVNMMQTIPEVNELIEKTVESWSQIIEDKDSKEIIRQMKQLHQIVSEDQRMGETITIIKEAAHTVYNNNASMRILRGGIKTLHRLAGQKQAVMGIIVDTMRILGDGDKMNFALATGMKIAPFLGTLQNLMTSTPPAQPDPEPLTQQKPLVRSLSARPEAPVRKISIKRRVGN